MEESKKKIEEISRENNKALKEKAEQEMEILELKREVEKLQLNVLELEKTWRLS